MKEILKSLIDTIEIQNIMIILVGFVGNLLLNVGSESNDKREVSKFIISYYSLTILIFIFALNQQEESVSNSLPLLLLIAIHIAKSISIAIFRNDPLIHQLRSPQIFVYYFLEVFFTSRLDVAYLFSLVVIFPENIFLKLLFTFLFLVVQLFIQIRNNFEVNSFQKIYNQIIPDNNQNSNFFTRYSDERNELLSFLIYLEDKDIIYRNTYFFNPVPILIRKYLLAINKYQPDIEFKLLDKKSYHSKLDFKLGIKHIIPLLKFVFRSFISKYKQFRQAPFKLRWKRLWFKLWRGYGTLPQQLVRIYALKNEGTYERNFIRRKIFIEYFYTHYFYKAMTNLHTRTLYVKHNKKYYGILNSDLKKEANMYVKRDIILSYYITLLGSPVNHRELFDSLITKAKTSRTRYQLSYLWDNRYESYYFYKTCNEFKWEIYIRTADIYD